MSLTHHRAKIAFVVEQLLFTSVDAQIRFAIHHRHLLQLRYKGALRVTEPHDYGVQKGIEGCSSFSSAPAAE